MGFFPSSALPLPLFVCGLLRRAEAGVVMMDNQRRGVAARGIAEM